MKKNKKFSKIIRFILSGFFLLLAIVIAYSSRWVVERFGRIGFSQILFHVMVPISGTDKEVIISYVSGLILKILLVLLILIFFLYEKKRHPDGMLRIKNKEFNLFGNKFVLFVERFHIIITVILLAAALFYSNYKLEFVKYFKKIKQTTTIYEDYYVSADSVRIEAGENKRNLIYIFLESVETSFTSKELGGGMNYNLIPGLSELAIENECFGIKGIINGAHTAHNTTWTSAGMLAQTSGVGLNLPIDYLKYDNYDSFVPGVISIGEILEDYGYNQMVMFGSEAGFAGRKAYFETHGNYTIYDVNTARERPDLPDDYNVFWGFEDEKLFTYAKEELLRLARLSKSGEPFNFTMLTEDTHTPEGYRYDRQDRAFEEKYDREYENVLYNADIDIMQFIEWIKEQDFYENTTIVIAGDHCSMAPVVENEMLDSDYDRETYVAVINSVKETIIKDKERDYTTFDLFPTTLSAMGFTIEGSRLGFGTDLYSDKATLTEILGREYLDDELSKHSKFYNNKLLYEK